MIFLPIFYKILPENIPDFVDLLGNPIISMEKSYISILRLSFMGLLLSVICIIMFFIHLSKEKQKLNKTVWSIIAFIGSLKMGLTSSEILFYENANAIKYFRIIIFVLVLIGIGLLLYGGIYKLYKTRVKIEEYKNEINFSNKIIIGIIIFSYIIIALMPMYYKTMP
jgi:hypothetical protein